MLKKNLIKRIFQKSDRCKVCRTPLTYGYQKTGFCGECGAKEIVKLKKRILVSGITGAALVVLVIFLFLYSQNTYLVSEQYGYKGDIFIPIAFGHFALNARTFHKAMNLSIPWRIFLLGFSFCAPFSSFVRIEFKTYRDQAERNLYKLEPIAGRMASGYNNQRLDEAGIFLMSVLLSAVSGPFYFVYRLYKLRQLSNCRKTRQENALL